MVWDDLRLNGSTLTVVLQLRCAVGSCTPEQTYFHVLISAQHDAGGWNFGDTPGDVCAIPLNIETVNLRLQVQGDQGGQGGQGVRVCHLYHLGHGDPEGDR